jgi:polyhydroxybutyrate depolymerase
MLVRLCVVLALVTVSPAILADGPSPPPSSVGRVRARAPSDLRKMEWKIGEDTREALVHIPESTKGAPLLFAWHGHGGTMKHAAASFALHTLWPEAIVVYPQGLPTSGKIVDREGRLPGWQSNPGEYDDRDLKFFDAMLDSLKRDHKADPSRVFATGHSNGGRFTYLLWATRGDAIAAFAPSASPATGLFARMKPKPCLHLAGEKDRLVPFSNQQRTIDRMRQINGCDAADGRRWSEFKGTVTLYPSRSKSPTATAIYPGGHEFPKDAPQVIVKFFKQRDEASGRKRDRERDPD